MSCLNAYKIFLPIFQCEELIISFGLHPFDICYDNPTLWFYIKISFIFFYITSNIILLNSIISLFSVFQAAYENSENTISPLNNNQFNLLIGKDESTNSNVFIPESGLYQNFLITGTIGTGKTSSAMYPFTEQLMQYNSLNPNNKIAILILDVKGNYFNHIKHLASKYNLNNDIIEISLNSGIRYNPLHKPFLSPMVLANRLKTILLLFSENNSESFWLDKVEQVLAESIKLCRLYNNGYVTFTEIHKLITEPDYYTSKIQVLKKLFLNSKYSYEQIYELNTALNFFEKEFNNLDSRTLSILKSEITRITNLFVSDYSITKTDANFFSLSREAKCINIVCTQSYSSLKNTLKEDSSVKVIIQNLINKIWYRTDDIYTIEEAQKQLGKEDKQKTSTSISENAKETRFNYITHSLNSKGSNITESYNTYYQNDYIFDTNFFTRNLETFSSLAFLSDGSKILKPIKLKMFPYFK